MSYNYDLLWQPIEINKVTIRNRISLSPMGTHTITPVNTDSEEGIRYYEERARGGVGLIHTGAMFLSPKLAQGSPTYDIAGLDAVAPLIPPAARYTPDPARSAAYQPCYAVFKNLYRANRRNFRALNGAGQL